jgi:type IV pilus assembly protein PilE
MKNKQLHRKQIDGFTLIEVMIVVAIIAILMAVAFPSYTDHVLRGNRAIARGHLLDIANRQQEFFLNNKTYTANLTGLGFATDSIGVNKKGNIVTAGASDSVYDISATAGTNSYSLSAAPANGQTADTDCGTFTLESTGAKTPTSNKCWN